MIQIHRRRGKRVNAVVGLLLVSEFHAGTDIVANGASVELRGQVGLVGEDLVADIFGVDVARPGPGIDVTRVRSANVACAAHYRRHHVILLDLRPAGGIADSGRVVKIMLETHRHRIGGGVVVVGAGAVEIVGVHFAGTVQRGGRGIGRGVARQAHGRYAAVWRIVLANVQIVEVQTILGPQAERDGGGNAVALVFNVITPGVMRFFTH